MHVLFLPYPSPGHVTPTLPVARELLALGHRVTYAVTEDVAKLPAQIGASAISYDSPLMSTTNPPDEWTEDEFSRAFLQYISEITGTTAAIEKQLSGDRPDRIVYDITVWAPGRVLGRKWAVPTCQLVPVFASNESYSLMDEQVAHADHPQLAEDDPAIAEFRQLMADFLTANGIDPDETDAIIAAKGEHSLVFHPKSLQPCGETFGPEHAFVGPCLELEFEEADEWEWEPPDDGRPLLFASLGTVVNDHPDFFQMCAEAFADMPWNVVLATGGCKVDAASFPPNFQVYEWIPYATVLRHADAFICQAGMGGIMQSCYHTVPLVVVPYQPEQRISAARLVELGLAKRLLPAELTAQKLRQTVLDAVADQDMLAVQRRMCADIHDAGNSPRAAVFVRDLPPVAGNH